MLVLISITLICNHETLMQIQFLKEYKAVGLEKVNPKFGSLFLIF
jgi:hypothetical protein